MAWLTGWNRRKSKIINGSTAGTQINYQMQLTIHKGSGADTTTDIYLGTNVRNDFGDVRFASSDGSTLLNYWIESYTSGVSAIVWIQIDSIPASPSSSTIYIYYDNLIASSSSDGTNTFEFFDDFSIDLSKWAAQSGIPIYSIESGRLKIVGQGGTVLAIRGNVTFNTGILESTWDVSPAANYQQGGVGFGTSINNRIITHRGFRNGQTFEIFNDNNDVLQTIAWTGTTGFVKLVKTSTQVTSYVKTNITDSWTTVNTLAYAINSLYPIIHTYDNVGNVYIDNIRVRKYASPEPTWSCSGGEEVQTVSWLSGWNRRKSKIVNGSTSGTQTNYQMKLTVHKTTGIDTSTDIYLGTSVRNDFGDVRFTKPDGSTPLNYWIDPSSLISGISTDIWVQIDSIPAGPCTSTIYIYYDNSSQTSISNGYVTFLFFDDFNDGDYTNNPTWTRWTVGGTWDATSGYLVSGGGGDWNIYTPSNYAQNVAWEFKVRALSGTGGSGSQAGAVLVLISDTTGANADVKANSVVAGINGTNVFLSYGTTPTSIVTAAWTRDTAWHIIRVTRNSANLWELFLDDVSKGTGILTSHTTTSYLQVYERSQVNGWDDIRIRKYASPEPIFGLSSAEELNITAIDMILSTNTCAGPCSITANVTWQNLSTSSITFRPAILVDGTTIFNAVSDITIVAGGTGLSSITTTTLSVGSHSICPYPN